MWQNLSFDFLLDFSSFSSKEISILGFEAGGESIPSNIYPWSILGDESLLIVSTDRSSCFERNKVALRMEVLCDSEGPHICPTEGVGIYNPGYWGMVKDNSRLQQSYRTFLCSLHRPITVVCQVPLNCFDA